MSSVSCIPLKTPSSIYKVRKDSPKSRDYNLMSAIMWTLGSLLVSFNVEMSNNNSGILVSVTIANVILMLIATVLLGKGLKESKAIFVLPWLVISFWSMYQIQLRDIIKLYQALGTITNHSKIPWLSLSAYALSLLIRFHLTITVAYVTLQQWYNKKLAQEMKGTLEK